MASPLGELREAIQRRDYLAGYQLAVSMLRTESSPGLLPLVVRLLAAGVLTQESENRNPLVTSFQQEFGFRLAPAEVLLLIDLDLSAGRRQEAAEGITQLLEKHPDCFPALHRRGLCELARALGTPFHNVSILSRRWHRALASLSAACDDDRYWEQWTADRLRLYNAPPKEGVAQDARTQLADRLLKLLSDVAEKAGNADHPAARDALQQLMVAFQTDRGGLAVMAEVGRVLQIQISGYDSIPFPFGMLWFQEQQQPAAARRLLGELLTLSEEAPYRNRRGELDHAAPTYADLLRQWYSRFSGVRHRIRWGKLDEGEQALATLCEKSEECRPNPQPQLPVVAGAPRCCDPNCSSFATCNPAYALSEQGGRRMEEDAHRLAIEIALGRAMQFAQCRPPRIHEAVQCWIQARSLADVLDWQDGLDERITSQVMELLERFRRDPDWAVELLNLSLAAVPSPTLKGRFADRLLTRGIERCGKEELAGGVQDLRWAVRLNSNSPRAKRNLGQALQNLAYHQFDTGQISDAVATAAELKQHAAGELDDPDAAEDYQSWHDWAQEKQTEWERLSDDPDIASLLAELSKHPPAQEEDLH